jgi:flap endonuclease-1
MLKWDKPQEDVLKDFLITKKGFAESKVDSGIKKLLACQGKKNQARLDNFFKSAGTQSSTQTKAAANTKGAAKKSTVSAGARKK